MPFKTLENGITILKWHDEREVLILSTMHSREKKSPKEVRVKKPKKITGDNHIYNEGKASINLSNQFSNYGTFLRKTLKWYKKLAIETILEAAIVNALTFSTKIFKNNKISLIHFREQIVNVLLDYHSNIENQIP